MADLKQIKFVSPERLGYYDSKLKAWVTAADDALKAELQGKIDAANTAISNEETRAKAAEATNAAAAQAAQKAADDLAAYVGEFTASEGVDTVVKYIDAKTANIASDETVGAIADRVAAIEEDYLVEADKTELNNAIALKADQTALDAVSEVANAAVKQSDYDTKVAALEAEDARIAGLVSAEAERAVAAEEANAAAIKAISDDYLKKADKDELAADIKANTDAIAVLNGDGEGSVAKQVADAVAGIVDGAPEAYDTLKEISDWIAAHPESVAAINTAIQENKDAIDALEAFVGELPADETSENIVAYIQKLVNAEAAAREAADNGLDARLQAVEGKFEGDASVDSKIATAEQNAKDYADGLNTAMNARVAELEEIDHEAYKAADATLETAIKAYADAEDAKIEAAIGEVAEGKTVVQMIADAQTAATYNDTEVRGLITANDEAIDALAETHATDKATLEGAIGTKAAQADLDSAVARVEALEAVEHVEMQNSEIDALFAEVTA